MYLDGGSTGLGMAVPVSYTHLDVYKRQAENRLLDVYLHALRSFALAVSGFLFQGIDIVGPAFVIRNVNLDRIDLQFLARKQLGCEAAALGACLLYTSRCV